MPEFATSSRGYPSIRIGEYNFREHSSYKNSKGPKKRWICSRNGCRAFLVTIVNVVTSSKGRKLLVYKGYCFYLDNNLKFTQNWACARYPQCKARVTTLQQKLLRTTAAHNHAPPNFVIRNGIYIKL
ncbi:FLYWCH zinc finger domain-containing protein [Phthorimaea operculella]|nr:FLYWCH zinc finger domain-containing protein [Phthorimaea operculella]